MSFDSQNNILTVEPKKQRDLGSYTFHAAFSLKIPMNVFDELEKKNSSISSEDLFAWLISLDYVDRRFYLTENFGSLETFFLPFQFRDYKEKIYEILKQFYKETFTGFEIVPSLDLKNNANDKLEMSTLSSSSVKADIKLHPSLGSEALFLNKPYGSL
ncbi:MAG: hypothetical protein EOO43_26325, partial [Flavobacterium sp.]